MSSVPADLDTWRAGDAEYPAARMMGCENGIVPEFFVPAADSNEQAETVYADFARMCSVEVPPIGRRVFSIDWIADGAEWTATVGEKLRGARIRQTRRRGETMEVRSPLSDDALVLAIFPGTTYFVVTDARPLTGKPSYWSNPLMAGRPKRVELFAAP